ncbi:TetR/AcrR family transcriptional regulator [Paenibacillus doosanensis]|uniref:TetR/AcrR family transcriptional regulator n=1 Tax=Paenibacillus doosanensis TaxID=1229154 RepID=UPI00217FE55E|nr:TetR/AcrR family transcriptional regulator [Paenibacillus doosanensis]MCS7461163.1 TetR/AcrR family transcriptional regulator [Paenibacillus doosanensis]
MPRTNTPDARNRILQAAVKRFAENGFEGSRIEEIAREANVPKSLIYYHFKSKDEIREVLFADFMREYKELLRLAADDTPETKRENMKDRLQHRYKQFAERNADLIRIMFIESLKKSSDKPILYQVVEALADSEPTDAPLRPADKEARDERLIAEFFTGVIPLYSYLCFSESWVSYFNMEKERFDELFLQLFMATHGSVHSKT